MVIGKVRTLYIFDHERVKFPFIEHDEMKVHFSWNNMLNKNRLIKIYFNTNWKHLYNATNSSKLVIFNLA